MEVASPGLEGGQVAILRLQRGGLLPSSDYSTPPIPERTRGEALTAPCSPATRSVLLRLHRCSSLSPLDNLRHNVTLGPRRGHRSPERKGLGPQAQLCQEAPCQYIRRPLGIGPGPYGLPRTPSTRSSQNAGKANFAGFTFYEVRGIRVRSRAGALRVGSRPVMSAFQLNRSFLRVHRSVSKHRKEYERFLRFGKPTTLHVSLDTAAIRFSLPLPTIMRISSAPSDVRERLCERYAQSPICRHPIRVRVEGYEKERGAV